MKFVGLCNALLSVLVSILVVSYWRGGWMLWDYYTCSQPVPFCAVDAAEHMTSGWISECTGVSIAVLMVVLRRAAADAVAKVNGVMGTLLAILAAMALGFSCISLWRGWWYLSDAYILPGDSGSQELAYSAWISHIGGMVILMALGAERSVWAPPSVFLTDSEDEPLSVAKNVHRLRLRLANASIVAAFADKPPLLLAIRSAEGLHYFGTATATGAGAFAWRRVSASIADLVLSVGVVAHAVVWYWRGLWILFDHYEWGFSLDSSDLWRTTWASLAIGYGIYALELRRKGYGCMSSPESVTASTKASSGVLLGTVALRLHSYVLGLATVNAWRGVWYLWDYYSMTLESAWISHLVGIFGLLALGAFRSVWAPPAVLAINSFDAGLSSGPPPVVKFVRDSSVASVAVNAKPTSAEGISSTDAASSPPQTSPNQVAVTLQPIQIGLELDTDLNTEVIPDSTGRRPLTAL